MCGPWEPLLPFHRHIHTERRERERGRADRVSLSFAQDLKTLNTPTPSNYSCPQRQPRPFIIKIEICVLSAATLLMLNIQLPQELITPEYWQHGFHFFTSNNNCKSNLSIFQLIKHIVSQ